MTDTAAVWREVRKSGSKDQKEYDDRSVEIRHSGGCGNDSGRNFRIDRWLWWWVVGED